MYYQKKFSLLSSLNKKQATISFHGKIKSKLSSAHPYEPIVPPSPRRASSPRAIQITPLSYGGRSRYTRRANHHKKHHHHANTYKNN